MLETIFFVSLSITFILILMLVSHFKCRLAALEQKTESMYEIINYVTKEITTMKLLMQQAISLPSMAFTQQIHSSSSQTTHHQSLDGLGENNQSSDICCIKKIVVSDGEEYSDDDDDDDDNDSDEEEDCGVSLKVYINRDNTESEWESSDVSRLIDAHMLSSETPTMVVIRERNTDDYWPPHQQMIGLMGGDLGMMPTMIVMNGGGGSGSGGMMASMISVGTTSCQVEEIGDNDDDNVSIVSVSDGDNDNDDIVESGQSSESDDDDDQNVSVSDSVSTLVSTLVSQEVPVPVLTTVLTSTEIQEVPVSAEPEKYSHMDLPTLKRIAGERGIVGLGGKKKVEIIRMLENL